MWPRIAEFLLAAWLAASPWVLAAPAGNENSIRAHATACAALIALFALLSFRPAWEKAHLLSLAPAFWLIGVAFLQADPPPAAENQNFVITSLTLLLVAILPSRASQSPRAWREFWQEHGG